jgi:flagella basal body P-ring formation protein FlgA
MILRIFFTGLLVPVLILGMISNALATTDATAIREAVQSFMEQHVLEMKNNGISRVEFSITTLDNRLAFPDCNVPLQIDKDGQASGNRLMLKVGCPEGAIWSIYVPVALNTYREVVIAQQPLQRGSTISTDQIQLKETDISLLRNQYFTDASTLIGKQVRRPIREGNVITADSVEEPLAIRRGDAITIVANSGPLTVKMQGTAMGDGRIGEQISVRNQSSEKIIKATVKGQGEVIAVM